jgi:hypothetical protein
MITVKRKIEFSSGAQRGNAGRASGQAAHARLPVETGRIPRISRLMAIAIRLDRLLRTGEVSDMAELARLGHVSQPRMSQILNLTLLAPDIQEALLCFPRVATGKAAIHERMLRPIAAETDWARQREMWTQMAESVVTAE